MPFIHLSHVPINIVYKTGQVKLQQWLDIAEEVPTFVAAVIEVSSNALAAALVLHHDTRSAVRTVSQTALSYTHAHAHLDPWHQHTPGDSTNEFVFTLSSVVGSVQEEHEGQDHPAVGNLATTSINCASLSRPHLLARLR